MNKKDTFTAAINVRVEEDLRDALERLAERDHRPLANYVRVVLEKHVHEVGAIYSKKPELAPALN